MTVKNVLWENNRDKEVKNVIKLKSSINFLDEQSPAPSPAEYGAFVNTPRLNQFQETHNNTSRIISGVKVRRKNRRPIRILEAKPKMSERRKENIKKTTEIEKYNND